jgi:hypothetical protein
VDSDEGLLEDAGLPGDLLLSPGLVTFSLLALPLAAALAAAAAGAAAVALANIVDRWELLRDSAGLLGLA